MKKTLEIIEKSKFPIQVTSAHWIGELNGWIAHFHEKKIPVFFKQKTNGRVEIWRSVTKQEIEEIKTGKLFIRLNSFTTELAGH